MICLNAVSKRSFNVDIFSFLPGSFRYEDSVSGLFRYFYLNSKIFRHKFLDLISKANGSQGVFTDKSLIHCRTEVFCDPDNISKNGGRIDILCISDNMVIGIESKFSSDLSDDQNIKYLNKILSLKKQYGLDYAYFTIITPEYKKDAAKEQLKISRSNNCDVIYGLSWEQIKKHCIDDSLKLFQTEDTIENFILIKQFSKFLEKQIGPIKYINHLKFKLEDPDADLNVICEVGRPTLDVVSQFFNLTDSFGRWSTGSNHTGFSIFPKNGNRTNTEMIWIGFMKNPSTHCNGKFKLILEIFTESDISNLNFGPNFIKVEANPDNVPKWGAFKLRYVFNFPEKIIERTDLYNAFLPVLEYSRS